MELIGIAAAFVGLAFLAALPLMALLLLADTHPSDTCPHRRPTRDR